MCWSQPSSSPARLPSSGSGDIVGALLRRFRQGDSGLTLVELLVASGLAVVVLTLVGTFMVSSFSAQDRVATTGEATSSAQLAMRQLESGLRSASAVGVFAGNTSESQLLVARTETGTGSHSYACEAWYYDDVAKAIFHTSFTGQSTWPWGSSITNWIDLGSGLTTAIDVGGIVGDTLTWLLGGSGQGATGTWTLVTANVDRPGSFDGTTETPVFAVAGGTRSATISFEFSAGEQTPILMTTTATGRQAPADTDPTCF